MLHSFIFYIITKKIRRLQGFPPRSADLSDCLSPDPKLSPLHMQDRIRRALFVRLRPFICPKTHVRIKADRLRILFVDRQLVHSADGNGMLRQPFADSPSSLFGGNKQHFKFFPSIPAKATAAPFSSATSKQGTSRNACGTYRLMRFLSRSLRNRCVARTELSQTSSNPAINSGVLSFFS